MEDNYSNHKNNRNSKMKINLLNYEQMFLNINNKNDHKYNNNRLQSSKEKKYF